MLSSAQKIKKLAIKKLIQLTMFSKIKKSIHDSWLRDWLFFATDSRIQLAGFGELNGLKLPQSVIDKIYLKNAENWLGSAASIINKN